MTGRRSRLGKVVGSVRTNPEGWYIFPNATDTGWWLAAPSGARWAEYPTREEAARERDGRNAEWFAS